MVIEKEEKKCGGKGNECRAFPSACSRSSSHIVQAWHSIVHFDISDCTNLLTRQNSVSALIDLLSGAAAQCRIRIATSKESRFKAFRPDTPSTKTNLNKGEFSSDHLHSSCIYPSYSNHGKRDVC